MTPLHHAALVNTNPAVLEALLDAGADPGIANHAGEIPADFAGNTISFQGTEALRRLQEARDGDGWLRRRFR